MTTIQNLLIYCGIYNLITGIWRVYELQTKGLVTPKKRDTYIALGLSAALLYFMHV